MNRFVLALALFSGFAAVPATALAMEPYLPRSPKVFERVDGDHNGKITREELQPKAEQRFQRMDADSNGEVSTAEIDAALERAVQLRRNRILKAMDADTSGTITKAELDGFIDALMKAADADGDGGVTLDEAKKLRIAKLRKPATGDGAN